MMTISSSIFGGAPLGLATLLALAGLLLPPLVAADEGGDEGPVLLVIQGRLQAGAEGIYQQYLAGTQPLMAEYGATILMVGSGLDSEHAGEAWPINAVLEFPNRAAAEGFLGDPRYLELKKEYRDRAYETLNLTLVAGRAPIVRTPKQVAEEAFEHFRHGLATGEWQGFLARLSDDFTFRFPFGRWQGTHQGRDKAAEFFPYVSETFAGGLIIESVEAVTAEENRVVFEFHDRGKLRGQPYENRVAIALEVCGEQVCGYREYFGLVGPPPSGD
ncbi:MAG: nuclear transport factor 2 family protein [Acidobacteriota bacterium]